MKDINTAAAAAAASEIGGREGNKIGLYSGGHEATIPPPQHTTHT